MLLILQKNTLKTNAPFSLAEQIVDCGITKARCLSVDEEDISALY